MNRIIFFILFGSISSVVLAQKILTNPDLLRDSTLYIGIDLFNNREFELAKKEFEQATKKTSYAYYWLGLIELENSNYQASLDYFNRIQNKDPDCLYSKAVTLYYLERYVEARKVLDTAIKLKPSDDNYYHLLSNLFLNQGQYIEALEAIEKAIQLRVSGDHFFVQGLIYERLKMPMQAEKSYANCYNMEGDLTALYNRARMEWLLGNNIKAISFLDTIILHEPNDCDAYLLKTRVYGSENRYDLVIDQLNKLPEINCDLESIMWIKGYALYNLNQLDSSLLYFSELIKINDSIHGYFFQRALIFLDLKDYQSAINDLEKAIDLNPSNGKYFYYLSKGFKEVGSKKKAFKALKKSSKLNYP